jgi:hypothetical protein
MESLAMKQVVNNNPSDAIAQVVSPIFHDILNYLKCSSCQQHHGQIYLEPHEWLQSQSHDITMGLAMAFVRTNLRSRNKDQYVVTAECLTGKFKIASKNFEIGCLVENAVMMSHLFL